MGVLLLQVSMLVFVGILYHSRVTSNTPAYVLSTKDCQVMNWERVDMVLAFFFLLYFYSSWYLKAQHIAPKNGRPYNQLALLAVYTVRNPKDGKNFAGSILEIRILIASAPGTRFHPNIVTRSISPSVSHPYTPLLLLLFEVNCQWSLTSVESALPPFWLHLSS